jgi:hypothetical protein
VDGRVTPGHDGRCEAIRWRFPNSCQIGTRFA